METPKPQIKNAKVLKRGQKNILCYGPTGTGKTTLFTTWPGKKFSYIFDPGTMDTIAGVDLDYDTFFPDPHVGIRVPIPKKGDAPVKDQRASRPGEPIAYADFEDHLEDMIGNAFYDYEMVGFHSITSLQNMTMERLLYISKRQGQQPEWSDFNMVGESLMSIFRAVLASGVSIYVEGHDDLVQDELSKRIYRQFDVTKGVRRHLPRIVTDMWISEVVSDKDGKPAYRIQTRPDKTWPQAKNSFGMDYVEDVTLDFRKPREEQGIGAFLNERR
jgi:hypothetical protein